MLASDFEFRHRTWFIFGIFCVGLACYWLDQQVSGEVLAGLCARIVRYCRRSVFEPVPALFSL